MRRGTGTPKFLVWKLDYSRAPCLGADQKARGLWERDCTQICICINKGGLHLNRQGVFKLAGNVREYINRE